jgi:hypothetical protein
MLVLKLQINKFTSNYDEGRKRSSEVVNVGSETADPIYM